MKPLVAIVGRPNVGKSTLFNRLVGQRLAIVEFPSAEAARLWHSSEAYAPARKIREKNATTHWIVVMDSVP